MVVQIEGAKVRYLDCLREGKGVAAAGSLKNKGKTMSDQQKKMFCGLRRIWKQAHGKSGKLFKRALSEDDGLRLQYVDALMNRAESGPYRGGRAGRWIAGRGCEWAGGIGEAEVVSGAAEPDATGVAGTGELEDMVREAYIGERENEMRENEMVGHGTGVGHGMGVGYGMGVGHGMEVAGGEGVRGGCGGWRKERGGEDGKRGGVGRGRRSENGGRK